MDDDMKQVNYEDEFQPSFKQFDKNESLFRKFVRLITTIFFPVKIDEISINKSASEYLESATRDELSRTYDDVRHASLLCERALIIAGVRADLAAKQQALREKIKELEKFETMPPEEKTYITNILKRYDDVSRERQSLRGQMSSFTKMLDYLEPIEKDVPGAIEAMDEAEEKQRRVKLDMSYINGERSDLEYQKEAIEQSLSLVRKIAIGITIVFSILAVGLLYLYFSRGIEIFAYALFFSAAVIVFATTLFIFRRRLIFEDKMNVLLQIRAVELLNRKKVLYVHYTSFLNYEYKKYRVKSCWELRESWSEYSYYKHVNTRYSNIRNIIYTIEDELQAFLKKYGLGNSKTSIKNFEKILDFENNKRQYKRFTGQLELTDAKLGKLEDEQKDIWNELLAIKNRDTTQDKAIERMMNEYFEDVSRVLPIEDEKDEFDYNYG